MVINLSDTAITSASAFTTSGQYLSSAVSSVAAGSSAYLFGSESALHSAVIDTLTNIENINVSGSNGINYIVGSDVANVITGGSGVDTINPGNGADTVTGGAGADAITLTETSANSASDTVGGFATANQSIVASADTWTAAGNVAGETITFATGSAGSVDTVSGFVSGVDKLDVTTAATAPTTLIGIAEATALTDGTAYIAYGTYNATTGVFTTAAAYNATTAHDALLVEGDGTQTIVNEQDYVVLTGLNQALVAADFI